MIGTATDSLALPPGTLLVLYLGGGDPEVCALAAGIAVVRAACPFAELALGVNELRPGLVRRIGTLPGRPPPLLVSGEPIAESLRPVLTAPVDLGASALEILDALGYRPAAPLARLIAGIFDGAGGSTDLSRILFDLRVSDRTSRSRMRKKGFPPPRDWLAAARGIRMALELQARPNESIMNIGCRLGYASKSAVNQMMGRAFGLRPSRVRQALGWRWLLGLWLLRRGLLRTAAGDPARAGLALTA